MSDIKQEDSSNQLKAPTNLTLSINSDFNLGNNLTLPTNFKNKDFSLCFQSLHLVYVLIFKSKKQPTATSLLLREELKRAEVWPVKNEQIRYFTNEISFFQEGSSFITQVS